LIYRFDKVEHIIIKRYSTCTRVLFFQIEININLIYIFNMYIGR